jgi:transcriptional regulator with XRE-family HTH domain
MRATWPGSVCRAVVAHHCSFGTKESFALVSGQFTVGSQRELAERAGVPVTMISAYEGDQWQSTLSTLLRLLRAAGFDLRLHLAAYDPHDDVLAELEADRSESERLRRDRQLQAWRQATPAEDVA